MHVNTLYHLRELQTGTAVFCQISLRKTTISYPLWHSSYSAAYWLVSFSDVTIY